MAPKSCKNTPRSARAAIILLAMTSTFLLVFVVVTLCGNAIRRTPEPTSIAPTSIPKTTPPTTPKESDDKQGECPQPPTTDFYDGMHWGDIGKTIHGNVKSNSLSVQPVAISHDGNRVVLGSPQGNFDGPTIIKVLDFDGNDWNEVGSFTGRGGDRYGMSLSLSGNGKMLAIGAKLSDERGRNKGHVEVYQYGGGWKSVGNKLVGLHPNELFGKSIVLSEDGSRIAIGNGLNAGSVRIFEFKGDDWIRIGQSIVGESSGDKFGTAISLSADGSIVAIGASLSDENGPGSGSVRVFQYSSDRRMIQESGSFRRDKSTKDEGQWVLVGQKLLGYSGDAFGNSVSISAKGGIIAAGTANGCAKVFQLQENEWHRMGQNILEENDFGCSISLAPNAYRIAASPNSSEKGYVRIYDYDGNNWVQIGDISAPSSGKYFGKSVALSSCGDRLAIGFVHNYGENDHGRLRVYEFSEAV